MKKIISFILILCLSLVLFTSCDAGTKDSADGMHSNNMPSSNDSLNGAGKDEVNGDGAEIEDVRKIIKNYNLTLETKQFKEDCSFIASEAEKLGGYIANSSVSGSSMSDNKTTHKSARYTVRVPSKSVDGYVALISERCNVTSSNLTTEDITESYYGIQAQIDSLVIQENNLLAMLEKADNLYDMITLDDKLSEIRAQINALNYKIQNMDKSADYSYVNISLKEVIEYQTDEKTYWQELGETIVSSAKNFINILGTLLIAFIWILPFAIVIGAIAALVIFVKKRFKRKKKQNESKDS